MSDTEVNAAKAPAADSPASPDAVKQETATENASTNLLPDGATAWIAAVGITAALALIGFIVKFSREQLLGLSFGDWTATDLSVYAGRWAVDTVTIVLNDLLSGFTHPSFQGVALLLFFPVVASFILPKKHRHANMAALASIGLTTAALLWVLVWWEAPTTYLGGWLTTGLGEQIRESSHKDLMGRRAEHLRIDLFVSKTSSLVDQGKVRCKKMPDGSHLLEDFPTTGVSTYLKDAVTVKDGLYASDESLARLHWLYGVCVLVILAGWLAQSRKVPDTLSPVTGEIFTGLRLMLTLLLLPLASCLLPYVYGKLLFPTICPTAKIAFRDDKKQGADSMKEHGVAEERNGNDTQATEGSDAGPPAEPFHYDNEVLVLDQSDKALTLLNLGVHEAVPYFYAVDRSDVHFVRFGYQEDLLTEDIKRCDWFPY